MSESTFTDRICKELAGVNADVTAMVAHRRSRPGVPDRFVVHRDWIGMLEFKGAKTPLRKDQQILMRMWNKRRPGSAYVVREPGILQTEEGETLFTFENGRELIHGLQSLHQVRQTLQQGE